MKRFLFILLAVMVSFTSCELLDKLIPDVDTSFSHTFNVVISSNSGYTLDKTVNLVDSEDYKDFENNIKGFKVSKITYEISDVNVPDDMYFEGSLQCSEDMSGQFITVGSIPRNKFSEIPGYNSETELDIVSANVDKIIKWLDNPGKFYYKAFYNLTNPSENPYDLSENPGYSFKIKIKFYVTVLTGA